MAAEKVPAFQFYPRDWLSDERVRLMSHTERGVYITLLCFCWLEGSLPLETKALATLVHLPLPRFTKLWEHSPLKQCFYLSDDGRLRNKRLELEREKQDLYRRRQTDASKARWGSSRGIPVGMPETAIPSQSPRVADEEEDPKKERTDTRVAITAPPIPVRDPVPDIGDRAADLLERFPVLYAKHRHGARLALLNGPINFSRAEEICRTWPDDAWIDKLIVIFLTCDDPWIAGTDRGFAVFAKKTSWCDNRLREWETEHGIAAAV